MARRHGIQVHYDRFELAMALCGIDVPTNLLPGHVKYEMVVDDLLTHCTRLKCARSMCRNFGMSADYRQFANMYRHMFPGLTVPPPPNATPAAQELKTDHWPFYKRLQAEMKYLKSVLPGMLTLPRPARRTGNPAPHPRHRVCKHAGGGHSASAAPPDPVHPDAHDDGTLQPGPADDDDYIMEDDDDDDSDAQQFKPFDYRYPHVMKFPLYNTRDSDSQMRTLENAIRLDGHVRRIYQLLLLQPQEVQDTFLQANAKSDLYDE